MCDLSWSRGSSFSRVHSNLFISQFQSKNIFIMVTFLWPRQIWNLGTVSCCEKAILKGVKDMQAFSFLFKTIFTQRSKPKTCPDRINYQNLRRRPSGSGWEWELYSCSVITSNMTEINFVISCGVLLVLKGICRFPCLFPHMHNTVRFDSHPAHFYMMTYALTM